MSELSKAIKTLAGVSETPTILTAEVVSVDLDTRTCIGKALTGDTEIEIKARLMAEVDDGWLLIPKVGSTIIVVYSKTISPYVSLFSELDKVVLIAATGGIEVSEDGVKLNDGSYGGLVKVEELVSKINRLESKVDSLIQKYNTHTHLYSDNGTPGFSTLVTTSIDTAIGTQTARGDIENTTVTHGTSL